MNDTNPVPPIQYPKFPGRRTVPSRHKKELTQLNKLQRLIVERAQRPEISTSDLLSIVSRWDDLEERKRLFRNTPKPVSPRAPEPIDTRIPVSPEPSMIERGARNLLKSRGVGDGVQGERGKRWTPPMSPTHF